MIDPFFLVGVQVGARAYIATQHRVMPSKKFAVLPHPPVPVPCASAYKWEMLSVRLA
jgi:hypothetical protein